MGKWWRNLGTAQDAMVTGRDAGGDTLADGMEHRVVGALTWRLCGGYQDSSPGSEGQGPGLGLDWMLPRAQRKK